MMYVTSSSNAGCVLLQVDHTFEVRGVGSVVSGTAVNGTIAVGHRLLLGPNSDGDFTSVVVSGIQRSQVQTMMQWIALSILAV